jgi:hypothetical protein
LGRQGSKHSNTYRLPAAFLEFYFGPSKGRQPHLVLVPKKPRQTGVSKTTETPVQPPENPGIPDRKPRPAGEKHLVNTSNHKSAPPARSSEYVDRGEIKIDTSAPAIMDAEMSAFRALCSNYTNIDPSTAIEARTIFNQLVRAGHDPEELIEASYDHADNCRDSTNQAALLRAWLDSKVQGGCRQ